MDKKILIGIIIAVVILGAVAFGFAMNKKETAPTIQIGSGKTLVVYYSAQSHTKAVAEKVAQNLNVDTFEIIPEDEYTSEDLNWTNSNSRVSREHNDESLRNIKLVSDKVDNWESYDTVLIGYPIWWRNCSMASRYICKSK